MNLKRISDAVSLKAYRELKQINPDNFYFVLANAIANALEKKLESISGKALGNEYRFSNKNGICSLTISDKTFSTSDRQSTTKILEDLIKQLFDAEFNGLEINRPGDRILLNDRNDFKKAVGTVFPSMYIKVKKDNPLANNQPNNSKFLTEQQFDVLSRSRKGFKSDKYDKCSVGGITFYLKKDTVLYNATKDLQSLGVKFVPRSLREYSDRLYNSSKEAKNFYDRLEYEPVYCIIKNALYELIYQDGEINISRKI